MKIREIRQLHSGDEVFWNDPNGDRSRVYTIQTIELHGKVARIVDTSGDVLECFITELS